eukprot:scaffold5980_cov145-Isochrysis_galbana.AAC.9
MRASRRQPAASSQRRQQVRAAGAAAQQPAHTSNRGAQRIPRAPAGVPHGGENGGWCTGEGVGRHARGCRGRGRWWQLKGWA